jgi:spore germination cell wall hydrolase CwlJ-like protein
MLADNARNRMLVVILALIASMSMGLNVKQLFDISHYKNMASQAHQVIENLLTIRLVTKDSVAKTRAISPTELQCMAENIYFEAGSQSLAGKLAVGHVVLNRMRKPNYPNTACGVVNHKIGNTCMFSWKCEGTKEIRNAGTWKQSQQVAYDLLSRDRKDLIDITEGATHFHNKTVRPGWNLRRVAEIDDHYFYK